MLSSSVLTLLSSALAVSAIPAKKAGSIIKMPVSKYVDPNATAKDIIISDLARYGGAEHIFGEGKRQTSSSVSNGISSYLASVTIGGTSYNLIVDTGSSNTWVGAGTAYSGSGSDTGDSVEVSYGSGSFSGEEYLDDVTITDGLTISQQSIGVASSSSGFSGVDGIIGVGPEDLTANTVSGTDEVPTVVQNAYSQGLIPAQVLGVYFAPNEDGELTWGGTDDSLYTGDISYQSVGGSQSQYWGISTEISIGGSSQGSSDGIVDTGTTLIYLPTSVYNTYIDAIPSASLDSESGLVKFPSSSLNDVPAVAFDIGGTSFSLNNYGQLVEKALYSDWGLDSDYLYSWVNDGGSEDGLIIGQKFMERFYAVFDTDSNQIGFAKTSNSKPTSIP